MSTLDAFAQPAWRHLVFALLHTLWQGALLALLLALALRRLAATRQDTRYLLALSAQLGVLVAGLITWAVLDYEPVRPAVTRETAARLERAVVPSVGSSRAVVGGAGPVPGRSASGEGMVPYLAAGWLAGVGLMLVRTARAVGAAWRLGRSPRVVDREILEGVERLRGVLGIGRRVRVVAAEGGEGPAVLGVVWPTLVLPVAMMTGLPPEAVQAILAHELAHIRRHDYVLNLGQMLVEALLFFNPAVWWLGRVARLEREACCDRLAVRLMGRPLAYSRSLADWAERTRGAGVALAWGGGGGHDVPPLLERVRRVLRPGDRPEVPISWGGLAVLLLIGPLVLAALWCGTTAAVALAAQVLSPAERIARVDQAQAEYAPPVATGGKVTLRGIIRGPNGRPLEKGVSASVRYQAGNTGGCAALGLLKGVFAEDVPAGTIWLYLEPDDYAPQVVGPFKAKPSATVAGIEITLEPGFAARVRVVDERGKPVAGARVKGCLEIDGGSCSSSPGWVADEAGIATIAHAARAQYALSATAPGFQVPESRKVSLAPDALATLTLIHGRPARGVVVTPEGTPVAGATIRPFFKQESHFSQDYSATSEPVLATTDEAGRFTLDTLDDDARYIMLVESKEHGRTLTRAFRAGQEDLRWTLGPELSIVGTIIGDLATLERERDKPIVRVSQVARRNDPGEFASFNPFDTVVPVELGDKGGTFRVARLLPGKVVITAGACVVPIAVDRPGIIATIDLSRPTPQPQNRRVVLKLIAPDGTARPGGSVQVYAYATRRNEPSDLPVISRTLPLEKGEITFETPTPGQVSYQPGVLIGYWFKAGNVEVEPGAEPLRVEIPAVPAGAIVGQVLGPDGAPAIAGVSLGCHVVAEPPPGLGREFHALNNVRVDAEGRFFLAPVPLGGTYIVVADQGHNRQVSAPLRLDGTEVIRRVVLRLARTVPAEGRVIGPDGRALEGVPVTLQLNHPQAATGWGPPTPTDYQGKFRFDDLSSELGEYGVFLDLRKDYQPVEARLNPAGAPITIRLERGHLLEGRVVDAATGWPIPGVEVYAASADQTQGAKRSYFEAEGKTDEQGRFRFSTLPLGPFRIGDRAGLRRDAHDGSTEVLPDRPEPVTIRGTLPVWSKLKPVSP